SLNRHQGGDDLYKFVDSEEFKRALNGDMQDWMLFLAPHQRSQVQRKFNGPARIKGIAGSGKTVVAIHRTYHLAKTVAKTEQKVLFLTYGNRLPSITKYLLQRLAGESFPVDERIEFATFHQWCRQFLLKNRALVDIADSSQLKDAL